MNLQKALAIAKTIVLMKIYVTRYLAICCCAIAFSCSTPTEQINIVNDNPVAHNVSVAASYSPAVIRENPCRVKTHDSKVNSITSLLKDAKDWVNQCLNDAMLAFAE